MQLRPLLRTSSEQFPKWGKLASSTSAMRAAVAAAAPLHAVCITGQERSFGEIGANVREGVLRMLGTPRVAFFGVKPVNDPWTGLQKLLPLTTVIAQHKCWAALA